MEGYHVYKDSGIPWLGLIPKHWKIKKLKHIGESRIGLTYKPSAVTTSEKDGILILRSSNIQDQKISFEDTVYVNGIIPEKLKLRKGDILICSRNGSKRLVGKNICIDEKGEGLSFGAFMTVFRTPNWRFISKIFQSNIFTSQSSLFLTTTINQLTQSTLNNLYTPFPPKEEQTAIAAFLDHKTAQIDAAIEQHQQLIKLLREERAAVINEAITKGLNPGAPMKDSGVEWIGEVPEHWVHFRGDHLFDLVKNTINQDKLNGKTIFHYSIPVVQETGTGAIEDGTEISSNKFILNGGEILFSKLNPRKGTVCISEKNECLTVCSTEFVVLLPKRLNLRFAFYLYKCSSTKERISSTVQSATKSHQRASPSTIHKLWHFIPNSMEEQKQIAAYIDQKTSQLDQEINMINEEISLLQKYRQSLIAEAVTGKIDVRDYPLN